LTRPNAAASSAPISAPRVMSSKARFSETFRRRIAITIAGTKPIFTSG
jgi:hypothetical protein